MHNRVFRQIRRTIRKDQIRFVDVTALAFECGFPFRTYISRPLLTDYTVSGIADDDDGRILVESIFQEVLAAMTGEVPSASVSYGPSFELTFEFVAQSRRHPMPTIINLHALIGPWNDPLVHVWAASKPAACGDAPEADSAV
jgi:hypothetical protein